MDIVTEILNAPLPWRVMFSIAGVLLIIALGQLFASLLARPAPESAPGVGVSYDLRVLTASFQNLTFDRNARSGMTAIAHLKTDTRFAVRTIDRSGVKTVSLGLLDIDADTVDPALIKAMVDHSKPLEPRSWKELLGFCRLQLGT